MKMTTKILLFAIAMVIASVTIISGLVLIENAAFNDTVSYDRLMTASLDLNNKLAELQDLSKNYAVLISENQRLIDAIGKNEKNAVEKILNELNKNMRLDEITVTDSNGKVIFRQHEPGEYGDIIISDVTISQALDGVSSATINKDTQEYLSSKSGAPVKNRSGNVIGAVSAGFVYENSAMLDELKLLHNTELTIYSGSKSIGTTIVNDGVRGYGDTLGEEIQKTVLEQGQAYTGKTKIFGTVYVSR